MIAKEARMGHANAGHVGAGTLGPDVESPVQYELLEIPDTSAAAGLLTLNRPRDLNAITTDMVDSLRRSLALAANDPDTRVLFITGRGRAFSAGGDLKRYLELQRDHVRFPKFVADLHSVFSSLRNLHIPVVALVNGITLAGGLELLISCDLAIAASSARIGDGHLKFGQMGGGGVLTLLPRMIGIQRSAELIFSGRLLSAAEAADWGLVSRVVPDESLLDTGLAFASEVAKKSSLAVANAKYVMNTTWADVLSVSSGLRLELDRNSLYCLTSHDAPEGLQAFTEKRTPKFQGR